MNYELIESYAKKGESHDVMSALTSLTKAYIDQCGVSLGYRTVIYCAAEQWLERLAWLDLPLSEMARKEALVTVMPYITSDYDPEKYDDYDIAAMNEEELMDGCVEMIRSGEHDELTNEVLCWGIVKAVNEELVIHKEIETVAPDGTLLKGVLTDQSRASTSIVMESPYPDAFLCKLELIRDAEAFLIQGYEDCKRIKELESEIRALYPKYQEKLHELENESSRKKYLAFNDVYDELIGDVAVFCLEKLFNKWFGLEFKNVEDKAVADKNTMTRFESDIFDFNNIPMTELDKAYIDYEPLYDTVDWYSVDEDYLYEEKKNNTNGIQSAVDVVTRAMNQLKMSEFQIKVKSPNGVEYIEVKRLMEDYPDFLTMSTAMLIPDIEKNVEIITDFMDEKGYYVAKKATYKDKGGRIWMLLVFDPKKQESIKEMVLKYHKYAYHTSPIYNAESIEKNGILSKYAITPFISNTQRIYLYFGNTSNPEYVNMMKSISKELQIRDSKFTGNFVEYEVMLKKIPENAEFYIDIHGFGKDFIYTETDIPIEAIRDTEDKIY